MAARGSTWSARQRRPHGLARRAAAFTSALLLVTTLFAAAAVWFGVEQESRRHELAGHAGSYDVLQALSPFLIFMLCVIFVAAPLAMLVVRRALKPLDQLTRFAEKIAE